jgi:integrase
MFKINKEVRTKPEVKEKIIFSDEDIVKIFNGLAQKNENFQVLIHILFYTGLRSSDILKITCEKIDFCERCIKYFSPKRKKYREVAFHEDLLPIFSKRINNKIIGYLLEYKTVENLGRAVTRYFSELKFPKKKYTARTFRKTFISLARSRFKMDASVVKELIGHEPGNTTDKFYNQITIETMRDELSKFKRPTT